MKNPEGVDPFRIYTAALRLYPYVSQKQTFSVKRHKKHKMVFGEQFTFAGQWPLFHRPARFFRLLLAILSKCR